MPLIMNKNIKIGNHIISENSPVFCIGELSCNHLNNYELAMKTIDAMIDAGVDCIKLQTAKPDKITLNCDSDVLLLRGGLFGIIGLFTRCMWRRRLLGSGMNLLRIMWNQEEWNFCLHHLTKVRLIF